METSTLNGANGTRAHGIVPLSMKEIELVAGGKAAQTPTSAWDRFIAWLESWLPGGSSTPPPQQTVIVAPSGAEVARMLEICVAAGRPFEYSGSAGEGSANLSVVSAGGTGASFRIICN